MTQLPPVPDENLPEKLGKNATGKNVGRLVGLLALIGVVAAFVFQNSQDVAVRFWFITRHPPLIFVVVGSLLIGSLFGYISGRRRGARRGRRRLLGRADPELGSR
jgi:uncharacterized integral membrane protein